MIFKRSIGVLFLSIIFCLLKCSTAYPKGFYILEVGMREKDRDTVLKAHNHYRLQIAKGAVRGQPKACDMMQMKYDMELERQARKIAETCVFAHVTVRDSRWFAVGQNLAWAGNTARVSNPNWWKITKDWFDEQTVYTYPGGFSSRTGHYTQVVWATTTCVGCSYIHYRNPRDYFGYQKLYVCNYGPAGNIKGRTPYQSGCRSGCDNLCSSRNGQCSGTSRRSDFWTGTWRA